MAPAFLYLCRLAPDLEEKRGHVFRRLPGAMPSKSSAAGPAASQQEDEASGFHAGLTVMSVSQQTRVADAVSPTMLHDVSKQATT